MTKEVTVKLKIEPINKAGAHRTGSLAGITVAEINNLLGFKPNVDDDPGKVKYSWGFKVGEQEFGIWDYKGSARYKEFSTYGDHEILGQIFGNCYNEG